MHAYDDEVDPFFVLCLIKFTCPCKIGVLPHPIGLKIKSEF